MEDFLMVNISFNVGSDTYSDIPPQVIFAEEAEDVAFQNGIDEYDKVHGLTLLSVSGALGGVTVPPLTFTTSEGTFTASSDNWTSPEFQANFSGTLGIFVAATEVSNPTATPEPGTCTLVLIVIGLLYVVRRHISLYPCSWAG
jgi:hypothetical protein